MKNILYLFLIVLAVVVENIDATSLKKCTKSSCKFGGSCINGYCSCQAACRKAGFVVLCGSDRKYYFNYCYLMMRSCELQREIKIVGIGYNKKCKGRAIKSLQGRQISTEKNFCSIISNHCQNYGICVKTDTISHCLCPYGYSGDRCQFKIAPLSNIEYNRKHHASKQTGPAEVAESTAESYVTWLLLFCALSALLSAVVTSGFCHRMLHKKLTRMKRENMLINSEETDSRSDDIFTASGQQ